MYAGFSAGTWVNWRLYIVKNKRTPLEILPSNHKNIVSACWTAAALNVSHVHDAKRLSVLLTVGISPGLWTSVELHSTSVLSFLHPRPLHPWTIKSAPFASSRLFGYRVVSLSLCGQPRGCVQIWNDWHRSCEPVSRGLPRGQWCLWKHWRNDQWNINHPCCPILISLTSKQHKYSIIFIFTHSKAESFVTVAAVMRR